MNAQRNLTIKYGDGTVASESNVYEAEIAAHIYVDSLKATGHPEHEQWAMITSSMNPHWCQEWSYRNGKLKKLEYDPTELTGDIFDDVVMEEEEKPERPNSTPTRPRTKKSMRIDLEINIDLGWLKMTIKI